MLYAGIGIHEAADSTVDPELVNVWDAGGFSFAGAVHGEGEDAYWINDGVLEETNACLGGDLCIDVTDKMHQWRLIGDFQGRWDGRFGFTGDEDDPDYFDRYSYKHFDPNATVVVLNVNNRPLAPTLVAPAQNALTVTSTTPTLAWNPVTDPDGDVRYTAMVAHRRRRPIRSGGKSAVVDTRALTCRDRAQAIPRRVRRPGVDRISPVTVVDHQTVNEHNPPSTRRF